VKTSTSRRKCDSRETVPIPSLSLSIGVPLFFRSNVRSIPQLVGMPWSTTTTRTRFCILDSRGGKSPDHRSRLKIDGQAQHFLAEKARKPPVDREREGEAYLRFQTSVCRSASSSGQGARVAVREEEQAAGVEMGCLGGAGVRRRGDAENVRGVGLRARGERGGGVGGHPVQCIPTPVLFANERREGWCSGAARVGLHCFSERADGRGGRKRVSPCCCDANVNARARAVRDGTGREARRRAWKWAVWVGRGWRRRQRKTSLAFACHGASHSSAHGPCEKAPHVLIECNLGLPPI
jgi:hypothetical protein